MHSKPQFRDYSPEIPKFKADTDYEFSLEGARKMTSIGNGVAGNALAKAGPTAMDWTVEPGGWRAAEDPEGEERGSMDTRLMA
jgi:hypothetical protein